MKTPGRLSEKRSQAVKISLTPTAMDKLVFVAETLGIAPSQVAAVAVSEYVAAKAIAFGAAEKTGQQMIEAMTPHMAEMFQNLRTRKSTNADSSRHPPRRNRSRWWHQQKPGK